jgi:hypothetical protein
LPANIRLTIPVTPPSPLGTTKGGHIYVEAPDQSSTPTARMDGTTLMDGSTAMQGPWAPIDLGQFPYVTGQQAWVLEFSPPNSFNSKVSNSIRVYVAAYSNDVDKPLVRYGATGATPSVVVTIPAAVSGKPNSGSNVTPFLVTGISGAVSAAVSVGGKLRRPIGITVDLSGLPTGTPTDWAYQLQGYANGDLSTTPILVSGLMTVDGLIPAGPDGITIPHTFGPEEPTTITSITVYAVAGLIAGSRLPGGRGTLNISTSFTPNNIIPGITASCVVSIGTTGGVADPTAFIQSLLDTSVGVVGAIFGVLPLGVDAARIALLAVDTTKLAALAVTAAKLGGSSVTATAIANLAVGTAAIQNGAINTAMIQNAAITNALIGNLAVGTAQIQLLAVGDAQIATLNANKIIAGTIMASVSLTSPTIVVSGSGYTINLDSPNGFKMTSGVSTLQIGGAGASVANINITESTFGGQTVLSPGNISAQKTSGFANAQLHIVGGVGTLSLNSAGTGALNLDLTSNGFSLVNGATPFSGTLAAAIAAGRSVSGGVIV